MAPVTVTKAGAAREQGQQGRTWGDARKNGELGEEGIPTHGHAKLSSSAFSQQAL